MKATFLLKHNITTMLKARGQTRHDLAFYCRRSDAWLSKLMSDENRNVPVKYFDRIADFFGIATYQLFQPGISPLTERRRGSDRRSGQDRRISAKVRRTAETAIRQIPVSPEDEALLAELRALTYDEYQRVKHWIHVTRLGRPVARETTASAAPVEASGPPTVRVPRTRAGRTRTAR